MELGAFSVSLSVKNIPASKEFYEKIGFKKIGGDETQNWLIMRNGDHTIGLFQGMFDTNILTFNPGWDKDCNQLEEFQDIREIYQELKNSNLNILENGIKGDKGPSHFSIQDPDGNLILFDQHV
jgi:catechol 2,3-dioxygenase-like lactoylglutathione lyase family enzyme